MLFVSHYNGAVKRSTRSFFLLATVTAFGALAPHLAGYGNTALHFNFGPGDLAYLEGFEPMWEIDPDGRATHWTSYESTIRLPLGLRGGRARLTYHFSRVYGQTADVEIRVNGVTADWV